MVYEGAIKGFPKEVVEKMLYNQVLQGNRRDVKNFEDNNSSTKPSGGFQWDKTEEGHKFWSDVILKENFDVFYNKYPKSKIVFEEGVVYQAETQEEAKMLLLEAHKQGYKWLNGNSYINYSGWNYNRDQTYYNIFEGRFGNLTINPTTYNVVKVKDLFRGTLPEEESYFVECNSREETNGVMNYFHDLHGRKRFDYMHWNYVYVSPNSTNIYDSIEGMNKDVKVFTYSEFLIKTNQKNEFEKTTITEIPSGNRGREIRVDNTRRQVTVGSRCQGNPTSFGCKKAKVIGAKISPKVVSY